MKHTNATCKICKKPLVLEIDDDFPDEELKKWVQMATCNRCYDLMVRRDRATDGIKACCEQLLTLGGKITGDQRTAIHNALTKLTTAYAQVRSDYFFEDTYLWTSDFPQMLMDAPDKWGTILNAYRDQFNKWRKDKAAAAQKKPIEADPELLSI